MANLAHTDMQRGGRWLGLFALGLLFGAGCNHATSSTEPAHGNGKGGLADGDGDGDADARPDADLADPCGDQEKREAAFVAAHRACSSNSDCVALGDCSNDDFLAVSASSKDEAQALIDARTCRAQDGPGYYAACVHGACTLAVSPVECGEPKYNLCPEGHSSFQPGCDAPNSFAPDCYVSCAPDQAGHAAACPKGFTCQTAQVDPCPDDPWSGDDAGACAACSMPTQLCLPEPGCQLSLDVALDGRANVTIGQDGGTQLTLTLHNHTDAPLTFQYQQPCNGPNVSGLPGYDVWDACFDGVCSPEPNIVKVTLAARETQTLAKALLSVAGSPCNDKPIAVGTYQLSFALEGLSGAKVCASEAAKLVVKAGNYEI